MSEWGTEGEVAQGPLTEHADGGDAGIDLSGGEGIVRCKAAVEKARGEVKGWHG